MFLQIFTNIGGLQKKAFWVDFEVLDRIPNLKNGP